MSPWSKIAAIALAMSLAACAQKPYPPQTQTQITDLSAATTPSPAPAEAESSGWVSTYPYGTAQSTGSGNLAVPPPTLAERAPAAQPQATAPSLPAPEPAPTTQTAAHGTSGGQIPDLSGDAGVTVLSSEEEGRQPLAPFQSGWSKPGATRDQHRADIESCYRYAFAQVDHDLRIDSDVAAARDDDDDQGLGLTMLNQRLNLYNLKNRRTALIRDCMEGKGYTQT